MITIWADDSQDSRGLIKHIHETRDEDYTVKHILTASMKPIVNINGYLIIGFGEICRFFDFDGVISYKD